MPCVESPAIDDIPNSETSLFVWYPVEARAANSVVAIARDDDYMCGIVHSQIHIVWALRKSGWLGIGNDPRYTNTTTFETFPFPCRLGTKTHRTLHTFASAPPPSSCTKNATPGSIPQTPARSNSKTAPLTILYNALQQYRGLNPKSVKPAAADFAPALTNCTSARRSRLRCLRLGIRNIGRRRRNLATPARLNLQARRLSLTPLCALCAGGQCLRALCGKFNTRDRRSVSKRPYSRHPTPNPRYHQRMTACAHSPIPLTSAHRGHKTLPNGRKNFSGGNLPAITATAIFAPMQRFISLVSLSGRLFGQKNIRCPLKRPTTSGNPCASVVNPPHATDGQCLRDHSVALTPHFLLPSPHDRVHPHPDFAPLNGNTVPIGEKNI